MLGKRIGPYVIQEELGRGGMATVYRAHQVTVDRAVAMKILHVHIGVNDTAVARFMSEARVIARLEHPHILPIYDFDGKHEPPYIVMRYMPSGTLKEAVERTALPQGEILYMYNQIASALDYAHRNDVVHRDIKPSNIMIDGEGNAFITDFGIARMISDEQGLTQSGMAIGTPGYMAPEQGLGQDIDGRADIYALGVMLYELITGTAPYAATTPMAVLMRHINDPIPSILDHDPEFSPQLQAVIERALAKQPENRYQTASEMVLAMRAALGGEIKSRPVKLQEAATMAMEEADERTSAFVEVYPTDGGTSETAETDMSLSAEAATAGAGHQYVPTERAPAYPPPRSELPPARRSGRLTYGIAGAAAVLVVIAIIAGVLLFSGGSDDDDNDGADEQAVAATETGEVLAVTETAIAIAADVTDTPEDTATATEEDTAEPSPTSTSTEEPTEAPSATRTDRPSDTPEPTDDPTDTPTGTPTDTAEPSPTSTSTDTDTPEPTNTRTYTPSPSFTPATPQAVVNTTTTQVRLGPGNEYPQIAFLTFESPVEIVEISADGLWVRVNYASFDGETGSGFVRTRDLDLTGGTLGDLAEASFPTLTYTPTDTPTEAVSATPTPTLTQTPSYTPSRTLSPTPSDTPLPTATHTPSETPTNTPTPTATPTDLPNIVTSEIGDNLDRSDECLYEFEFGDTLFGIAIANDLSVEELLAANPDVNPNNIAPGTEILVPDCGPEPPPLMSVVEGAVLTGHATGVNDTAVSPSGTRMASAGGDGTIRIYDTSTNEVLHILREHEDEVNAIAFSPDSRTLASASEDGTVRMWDVATGNLIVTLDDHNAPVNDVAFRPDGIRAVSGGDDNRVRIWELVSNRWLLQHAIPYNVPVTAVTYSPDGSTIGAGLQDGDVKIINRVQGGDFTLVGHTDVVTAVLFVDDDTLVSGSRSGAIRTWSVRLINPYGEEEALLQRHTAAVNGMALDSTRTILASGGSDRTIWLWHLPTATEIVAVVDGHSSDVYGVAFHPTGRRLVSGGQDSTVRTWQINVGGVLEQVIYSGPVTDVAYARDGLKIATASEDGVAVWDTDSSAQLFVPEEGDQPMLDVAFSPDSQLLAGAGQDRTVYLWDAEGTLLNTFSGHSLEVFSVAFSPDGTRLASGGADNTVRLWNIDEGSEEGTLSGHTGGVLGLAFSPDGSTLAAAAGDGSVTLWDVNTLAERAIALPGASDALLAVAFSPDGAQLAGASEDTTVRVWDIETGEVLHLLESHRADAYAVAYGANGMLVSAGLDGDIIRWNLAENEPLLTISGHTAAVTDLAFNANGIFLASASPDGTVRIWEMPRQ